MIMSDAVVAIAGLDTQQYFACKMMFQEIWKIYAVVHDQASFCLILPHFASICALNLPSIYPL